MADIALRTGKHARVANIDHGPYRDKIYVFRNTEKQLLKCNTIYNKINYISFKALTFILLKKVGSKVTLIHYSHTHLKLAVEICVRKNH